MSDAYNAEPGVVTVWSDIGCPWASLCLHVLRAASHSQGRAIEIDHRAFPLELFNRRPTPRPIIDAEVIAIVGLVPETGWRAWSAQSWHYPVSTLLAMEAVQAAKLEPVGSLAASDALDAALRHAFYAEGRCISIPSVIAEVAAMIDGLDDVRLMHTLSTGQSRSTLYQQWQTAKDSAIQGSPYLFDSVGGGMHNPGVVYRWTGPADDGGVPRFESYDPSWTGVMLS